MKKFKEFVSEGYVHPDHPDWSKTVDDAAKEYVSYRKGYNAVGKKGKPVSHKGVMNDVLYNSYQNVPKKHWDTFAHAVMSHPTVKKSGLKEEFVSEATPKPYDLKAEPDETIYKDSSHHIVMHGGQDGPTQSFAHTHPSGKARTTIQLHNKLSKKEVSANIKAQNPKLSAADREVSAKKIHYHLVYHVLL